MNASASMDELRPRRPGGMGLGTVLSLLAHAGLLIALSLAVNWRTSEPPGVEAELWAAVPRAAAPKPVEVPVTQPEPPKPEPKPEPPKVEPKPEPQQQRDADIAIEKAKKEKEKKKREAEEEEEKEKREKAAEKKKQAAEAQKKKEQEEARLAKLREENLKRMQGMVGATGGPTATGNAAQSAGPSANYIGRIIARIRPNISADPNDIPGNPVAVVRVTSAPDGTIIGQQLLTPSGNKQWDDAVVRAIIKTEKLPLDEKGRVPQTIIIDFRPRE